MYIFTYIADIYISIFGICSIYITVCMYMYYTYIHITFWYIYSIYHCISPEHSILINYNSFKLQIWKNTYVYSV